MSSSQLLQVLRCTALELQYRGWLTPLSGPAGVQKRHQLLQVLDELLPCRMHGNRVQYTYCSSYGSSRTTRACTCEVLQAWQYILAASIPLLPSQAWLITLLPKWERFAWPGSLQRVYRVYSFHPGEDKSQGSSLIRPATYSLVISANSEQKSQ